MSEPSAVRLAADASVPSPARIWDYYLGGKNSYAADRAVAEQVIKILPTAPLVARLTRQFLGTVVHKLAVEHGIRQFLDLGSGLPTADNTHQVAQRAAPRCRVVYVDSDPVAITHARALLTSARGGACDYLRADVRDVDTVLSGAARTLDFTRPVAVLMIQLLHFIPDPDNPYGIVTRIMDAVPSGSYLVLVHAPSDVDLRAAALLTKMAQASPVPLRLRNRAEVERFFRGLELTGPGLVSGPEWLDPPAPGASSAPLPDGFTYGYSGVARKP